MLLPRDATEAAPPPSEDLLRLPKRSVWHVVVFFAVVFLGIGGLIYREVTAPDPLKVLVAIDLEGTGGKARSQRRCWRRARGEAWRTRLRSGEGRRPEGHADSRASEVAANRPPSSSARASSSKRT